LDLGSGGIVGIANAEQDFELRIFLSRLGADCFIETGIAAADWFQDGDTGIRKPEACGTGTGTATVPEAGCDGEELIPSSDTDYQPPATSHN
jgi:hypothetical protein